MADAPKADSGGGWGFIEAAIAIFVVLALLSGALKSNPTTENTTNNQALNSALSSDGTCSLSLDTPIAYTFVGLSKIKVTGKLVNCTTADNQTAFFLQVIDSNKVPVTDTIAVPILASDGTAISFNMTIPFTMTPRTKTGTALFTPNVQNVSTTNAVRVPVTFRK
ncbi:MAG: hypothetical protein WCQ32_02335 [bacterium]